jgi:uncharacterized ferredoxin-like protein
MTSYDSWKTRTPDDEYAAEGEGEVECEDYDPHEPTQAEIDADECGWRLYNLAHAIGVAAGLCRAFELGLDDCDRIYYEQAVAGIDDWQERWHPGCGKPAP